MHHALLISEIVDLIIAQLDPLGRWQAAALAALARTSTIFHDSALDMLWKRQSNIENLIRCMPDGVWEVTNATLTPTRAITVADWDRVFKYAPRIKSVSCFEHVNADNNNPALLKVYETLRHCCVPCDYLLPHLEELSWYHFEAIYSPFIDLFLGPRVKSIRLGEQWDGRCPALNTLLARRLDLTSAVIDGVDVGSPESERSQLSSFIRSLTHPEFVDVRTIDSDALTHLGHLTTPHHPPHHLPCFAIPP
ncbi:hypothetical protein MVEN_00631800 [Mycena venus]|uniref:F-box domain-containing protein n=1 Tax=Mycena venus TaxID=2733690 RepID=A0A8H6YKI7_9AGAR|nr:hypothetical protein MVEN_00631800 [Mycena venus]